MIVAIAAQPVDFPAVHVLKLYKVSAASARHTVEAQEGTHFVHGRGYGRRRKSERSTLKAVAANGPRLHSVSRGRMKE